MRIFPCLIASPTSCSLLNLAWFPSFSQPILPGFRASGVFRLYISLTKPCENLLKSSTLLKFTVERDVGRHAGTGWWGFGAGPVRPVVAEHPRALVSPLFIRHWRQSQLRGSRFIDRPSYSSDSSDELQLAQPFVLEMSVCRSNWHRWHGFGLFM